MNPSAILALISDLYTQLTAAEERIAELESQLAESGHDQASDHPRSVAGDPQAVDVGADSATPMRRR